MDSCEKREHLIVSSPTLFGDTETVTSKIVHLHTADADGKVHFMRSGVVAPPTNTAFTTNLVSWWSLNEASGTRNDSHGTNHLTDNNTVTSTTGKQGNAGVFVFANNEYLSRASNASLQYSGSFTVGLWVKFVAAPGGTYRVLASKDDGGANREWLVTTNPSGNFEMQIVGGGGAFAHTGVTVTTGVWYFVLFRYDASATTISIQINNGTVQTSAAGIAAPVAGSAPLEIGRFGGSFNHDGHLDEVFLKKSLVTSTTATWLWNGGDGRTYAEAALHKDTTFQVAFSILKNGATIMQSGPAVPPTVTHLTAAYETVGTLPTESFYGVIADDTYVAGDVFHISVDASGATGTQAKGAFTSVGFVERFRNRYQG